MFPDQSGSKNCDAPFDGGPEENSIRYDSALAIYDGLMLARQLLNIQIHHPEKILPARQ